MGGGSPDRVLIYITLWIQKCLGVCSLTSGAEDARRQIEGMASADVPGPGDPQFILNPLFEPPSTAQEGVLARNYLKQLRQETVVRLLPLLYPGGVPNKWWFQFSKKRFMNFVF